MDLLQEGDDFYNQAGYDIHGIITNIGVSGTQITNNFAIGVEKGGSGQCTGTYALLAA